MNINTPPTHDQIFKAIEGFTGRMIVCFHDEAKVYVFKLVNPLFEKVWHTLDKCLVDDFAKGIKA